MQLYSDSLVVFFLSWANYLLSLHHQSAWLYVSVVSLSTAGCLSPEKIV